MTPPEYVEDPVRRRRHLEPLHHSKQFRNSFGVPVPRRPSKGQTSWVSRADVALLSRRFLAHPQALPLALLGSRLQQQQQAFGPWL